MVKNGGALDLFISVSPELWGLAVPLVGAKAKNFQILLVVALKYNSVSTCVLFLQCTPQFLLVMLHFTNKVCC